MYEFSSGTSKMINDDSDAQGISEFEFTTLMMEEATRKGLSFEKCFTAPENLDIRKAHQLTKATRVDVQPVTVEIGSTVTEDDSRAAYEALQAMAEKLRASAPYLSVSQAFARVFEDQKNAELAAKAHRRPSATTSYAFPQ
jgi:hypothetical protein